VTQQDTIDVQMPDGTVISGVPSNVTKAELNKKYQAYQAKKPPRPEGFVESYSKGMFGEGGATKTIKQSLENAPRPNILHPLTFDLPEALIGNRTAAARIAAPFKAVYGLGKSLITDVPRGLMGDEAAAGRALKGPGSLVGAPAFQRGIEQAEKGQTAGSLGSFAAGLTNAVLMLAPELAGAKGKKIIPGGLEDAAKGEVSLPSGQTMPVTKAMVKGGKMEQVAGGSIGGGPIRERYAQAQEAAQKNISELAKMSVTEQGATAPSALPKGLPEQVELYGKALRDFSSKAYYQPVIEAMSSPAAAQPVVENVAKVALKQLETQEVKGLLTRNVDLAPAIRDSLVKMAEAGGIGPEGRKFMGAQTYDPRTGQYVRGTPTFESPLTAGAESSFDSMTGAHSNLTAVLRSGRLSRGDQRIVSTLLNEIDKATTDALRQTGGEKLAQDFATARRLYRQGSAMEDFAKELGSAVTGRGETSIKGATPVRVHVNAKRLQAILEEMAYESPALPGRTQPTSRLRQAFPNPAHSESLKEIADLLARPDGDKMAAAMFGNLAELRHAGMLAAGGGLAGSLIGHPIGGAMVAAGSLPLGAAIFSRAIATPQGARLLLKFLQAAPASAQRANLGLQILKQQGATP